jgi:Transposase IS116/IS110/IS902 family
MITYKLTNNVVAHFPAIFKALGSKPTVIHLALDVELHGGVLAVRVAGGKPIECGKCSRSTVIDLAAELIREAIDWQRFSNRKQIGSYIGCCPSEYSTGPRQKLGSIDRQGNRRMRTLLVEAVWRLKKWNPGWRGFKKFPHVFSAHAMARGATRKRAVVACARLLAVDLWRLQTGRVTLEDLGLKPAQSR